MASLNAMDGEYNTQDGLTWEMQDIWENIMVKICPVCGGFDLAGLLTDLPFKEVIFIFKIYMYVEKEN